MKTIKKFCEITKQEGKESDFTMKSDWIVQKSILSHVDYNGNVEQCFFAYRLVDIDTAIDCVVDSLVICEGAGELSLNSDMFKAALNVPEYFDFSAYYTAIKALVDNAASACSHTLRNVEANLYECTEMLFDKQIAKQIIKDNLESSKITLREIGTTMLSNTVRSLNKEIGYYFGHTDEYIIERRKIDVSKSYIDKDFFDSLSF